MGNLENELDESPFVAKKEVPVPPPLPCQPTTSHNCKKGSISDCRGLKNYSTVCTSTKDMWERLFDEGYRADVTIDTDGGTIYAHANILGMASPVMKGMLKQAKGRCKKRSISIHGVPCDAVRMFIRFLYSSCYEKDGMQEFVLHLLVLSHVFVVPELKKLCVEQLEQGFLNIENVIDILQLSLLCDASRLSLICHRMISKNFQEVSTTEGWEVMKKSHPVLEKQLKDSVVDEENTQKQRIRKANERKIYLQLYEAMEALVHICRDGCRTIGPRDKDFKSNQAPCKYSACKGLELLVRHFAGCKLRVPGGCIQCRRMWQLLKLHSRICQDSDACRVPLCGNFKEKVKKQSKKDEIRWRIVVKKILRTKIITGALFLSEAVFS